ncbi:hypothetical protein [Arenimonas sp.]|uniref:hypothetical protein n=1 Tax=Arenimonas sp. TaxID=1872635 RepID=UPI002E338111|nr:hypothetical protein [Arenimonas sp.]HEX4853360.1 hypothetical protein [Arenimonas sp.]
MPTVLRPVLLLIAFVAMAPVQAQDQAPRPSQRDDAGARVRQVERDGGRVLQAEPMQRGGRQVYRLKVLTPEGRVRVLQDQDMSPRAPPREARFQLRERESRRDSLIRPRAPVRSEPVAPPPPGDEMPRERD